MSEEQLKAFVEKVQSDTSLQEKLKVAADADAALAIANEAGFAITAEDIQSMQTSTDLSDEELEAITGGTVATAIGFFYNLFTLATGIK
jgi:predicted ribosomally synthesized peptide with nif11-like leader